MNIRDIMRRATQASARTLDPIGSQSGGDLSPPSNDDGLGGGIPTGNPIPSLAWPAEPMDSVDEDGLLGLGKIITLIAYCYY
jgi:hypothetical protein